MRTLILLRHGEAEARAASGRDRDRALTAAGRADAALSGRAMAASGFTPDAVLVSPAVRTRQTWEAARAAFADPPPETSCPVLYDAPPTALVQAADDERADTVLLVAHNPGLPALADLLTDDPRLGEGFPPAAFAVLRLDAPGAPWRLVELHRPPRFAEADE